MNRFEYYLFYGNLIINHKLKIASALFKYLKYNWYSFSQKSLVFDNYISISSRKLHNLGSFSKIINNTFNLPLESLIIKNPEKQLYGSFLNLKNKRKTEKKDTFLSIFTLTSRKKTNFDLLFNINSIRKINTEEKANQFLEKLYFFNNNDYINYTSNIFIPEKKSMFNYINSPLYDEFIWLGIEIYSNASHVIELSTKKELYFNSLKCMIVDCVREFEILFGNHIGIAIEAYNINEHKEVSEIRNLLRKEDKKSLISKIDTFSLPSLVNIKIDKNFSQVINILKNYNQLDIIEDIFVEVQKILDRVEYCFNLIDELIDSENVTMKWGQLQPIIIALEQQYLQKVITVNNITPRIIKF